MKVLTLNIAHGRKDRLHQVFQKRSTIESHLDEIAQVLRRERPHVVALQEADGPSLWSGRFDHVRYLADAAEFPHAVRGDHVKGMRVAYGTALLSQFPLSKPLVRKFRRSPPTMRKGFVVSTIHWPARPELILDVVSVHLDFARRKVRRQQAEALIETLAARNDPIVILGDLNCDHVGRDPTVRMLIDRLNLSAYRPEAYDLITFPPRRRRLDWILVSPELRFVGYRTLPDVVSDHLGVLAELELADEGA